MKKRLNKLFIALAVLFSFLFILRITGVYALYTIPTNANYPNMKLGEWKMVLKYKAIERNCFLAFKAEVLDMGVSTVVYRLVGLPGDKLEIRNGDLYVNGKAADTDLNLGLEYLCKTQDFLSAQPQIANYLDDFSDNNDSTQVVFSSKEVADIGFTTSRVIYSSTEVSPEIQKVFPKSINSDHFGPVIVPANCYFVLGDNRHNSMDSRFLGFVKKEAVVGVMVSWF